MKQLCSSCFLCHVDNVAKWQKKQCLLRLPFSEHVQMASWSKFAYFAYADITWETSLFHLLRLLFWQRRKMASWANLLNLPFFSVLKWQIKQICLFCLHKNHLRSKFAHFASFAILTARKNGKLSKFAQLAIFSSMLKWQVEQICLFCLHT